MMELKEISAGYGKKEIIRGISGCLAPGQLVSFVGPNGAGKSTLLKALTGLLPLQSGQILLNGQDCRSLTPHARAKKVAYLPQAAAATDMTVEQVVLCGRFPHIRYPHTYTLQDRKIAAQALEMLEISHLAGRKLTELSGGQRQTAQIAMALTQETDYIFLDEPTTYLDISHQLQLMKMLRRLADQGKGIGVVMHDLPLAFRISDQVAVIRDGQLLAWDAPRAVLASGIPEGVFGVPLETANGSYFYNYCL